MRCWNHLTGRDNSKASLPLSRDYFSTILLILARNKIQEDIFMQETGKAPESWEKIINHVADMEREHQDRSGQLVSELMNDSSKREKRLIAIIVALVIAFVGTNAYWIHQWNSYDYVSQDGHGYNYYNSGVEGDINNGSEN
jgi:hypothetical protein